MESAHELHQVLSDTVEAQGDFEQAVGQAKLEDEEFRKLLPTSGFFHYYMRYTDRAESPDLYHFWVAATILAGVLQRRVWFDKGIYHVYPNLYTILVGPSGVTRKSRAIKLGTELIESLEFANVIADKTTPESLLEAMQYGADNTETTNESTALADSAAFIRASELSVFLNKASYTATMVTLLTDLFDSPSTFKYMTRNSRPIRLRNVSVNFLGASTPEWLATNVPPDAFEGGFMSRIIFVVRHVRSRFIAFPDKPIPAQTDALRQALVNIRRHAKGEMQLSKDARSWFEKWYMNHELKNRETAYNLLGFIERKPDVVIKLAMLLAIAEDPSRLTIDTKHFEHSLSILTWTQRHMFRAFENIDLSYVGGLRHRILKMLENAGGTMTRRDVMRSLSSKINTVRDLDEVEKIFEETGDVEVIVKLSGGRGRPSKIYKLVEGTK